MNLQHLKYAVEVERTGSITGAAYNLFMSQPNLSKAIRELEKEMGITLFARTSRGVVPTARGQEFLAYARTILSQVDELESLYKPENPEKIKLNLSVPRAAYISNAFVELLNRMRDRKEIAVGFREADALRAINDVASGVSNLSVIRYQKLYEEYYLTFIREKGLTYELLFEFRPMILCARTHPLAGINPIPIHVLQDYPEIVYGNIQVPFVSMRQISYGVELNTPQKRIGVNERESQMEILRQVEGTYMWVSPVPKEMLDMHGLILRESSPASMLTKDVLVCGRTHQFSPYETLFVQLVRESFLASREAYKKAQKQSED